MLLLAACGPVAHNEASSSDSPIATSSSLPESTFTPSSSPSGGNSHSVSSTTPSSIPAISSSETPASSSSLPPVASSSVAKTYTIDSSNPNNISGYRVNMAEAKESYQAGEVVSFTLTALNDFYYLDSNSVYYKLEGKDETNRIVESAGTYSFIMPEGNVSIFVKPSRMYGININAENATVNIADSKSYYQPYTNVSFTVTLTDGYQLDSVYISYTSGEDSSELRQSLSETNGTYSFLMPTGQTTINVITSLIPVADESDPWTIETSYTGSYEINSGYYYMVEYTFTFHGNGTLSWVLRYSVDEEDEWGEWRNASPLVISPGKLNAYSSWETKTRNGPLSYTYDSISKVVSLSTPGHYTTLVNITLTASFADGDPIPTSLRINENLSSEYLYKTANLNLTRN